MTVVTSSILILANLLAGLPLAAVPNTGRSAGSSTTAPMKHRQGEWLDSWENAVVASRDQQLPLVVHFEATWCGPCRRMATEVLSQTDVKSLLGSTVVGVRLDADRNRALIDEYEIETLPTELVIAPDGTEIARFVGAEKKTEYIARLHRVSQSERLVEARKIPIQEQENDPAEADATVEETTETRSCLIVRRDGKIVGLGGFSPVALKDHREWKPGDEQFVATYQEVEYFLQSADEARRFEADPERFIPRLHGCDLVELHDSRQAKAGVIELGAFYKGEMFFFASVENRERFQNNPTWYLASHQATKTGDDEVSPLLRSAVEQM